MSSSVLSSRKPYAIVCGLDSMTGIQTARILAGHQVPVIGVAKDPKHYCCRTKVCDRILFAVTASEALIETLEALGPTLAQRAVLYPCSDTTVLAISRNRQRLEERYHVVLPPADVVEMMMNKVTFYRYAQEKGFPIPTTRFLHSRADVEQQARELTFPCILKPPISALNAWEKNSKLKGYKVYNPEELLSVYDRYAALAEMLILQEWVEGPSSSLYSCNCYFDARAEPVVTFVARKLRQWPPETGESCLGEECRDGTVLQETIRLFKSVDYRGLGYVEMKRDVRTGEYFIIEPNIGRPTGRSAIAEAGGVELVYTMYCDALGWPLPENRTQRYGNVKWICLRRDFQSALYHWRKDDLTLREWWQSIQGRKAYALFSWTDLGPFLGDLERAVRLYANREEREKRDYDAPYV